MKTERKIENFYNLTGDEKSKVGNADPIDKNINWEFFDNKNYNFELTKPIEFKISQGRFSGNIGDFQLNSCGFLLLSEKLRRVIEKFLNNNDNPKWFPAKVIDLDGNYYTYSILHFFGNIDFLDIKNSTFVPGTDLPIKRRFDLKKIGERNIFIPSVSEPQLCVHEIVKEEVEKENCTGIYFYNIHNPGRLS
jgi:hypothetical protein